jgi:phosphoglycerate dehydrogenase-like enzyme
MAEEWAQRQFQDRERSRLREVADLPDVVLTDYRSDRARAVLADAEVVITSWGAPRMDAETLAAAPKLRAIVHAAGSVRFLASDEVWDAGISVSSMADLNGLPVAEYTLAMILLENKRVAPITAEFNQSRRRPAEDWYEGTGNYGRRVGLISASRIGRRVAELLRPFDLEVVIADPYCSFEEIAELGATKVELPELFATSAVISLHTPLLPETIGMIGADLLRTIPAGATLINTARGKIIDHEALIAELSDGRFRAVLDVTDPEPPEPDSPLWDLPNVLLTPHLAGSKGDEVRRMAAGAIEELGRVLNGRPLLFQVPPERRNIVA